MDVLIFTSLVQSAAWPPVEELDAQLLDLVEDQRSTLSKIARADVEAAQLIASHLSGYATLRKFYDLRDEGDDGPKKSGLRPIARRKEAAGCIVALVQSAADCIRGGLYDSEQDAVVQIDALLPLLGEALPLMNRELSFTYLFPANTRQRTSRCSTKSN